MTTVIIESSESPIRIVLTQIQQALMQALGWLGKLDLLALQVSGGHVADNLGADQFARLASMTGSEAQLKLTANKTNKAEKIQLMSFP